MKITTKNDLFCNMLMFCKKLFLNPDKIYKLGINAIDKVMVFLPGMFSLIGARSGNGKSRFIRHIMERMGKNGIKILYITIESSQGNFALNMIEEKGLGSVISLRDEAIRNKDCFESWKHLAIRMEHNASENVEYSFNNYLDLVTLKKNMRELKNNYDVFIIDYLQALDVKDKKGVYEKHWWIAEEMRALAIELEKCIIGVVQLNRQADSTLNDAPPSCANIEGSGHYEQTADNIILIKRKTKKEDNYYKPLNDIEFYIAKNRMANKICRIETHKDYREIINHDEYIPQSFGGYYGT